MNHIAEIASGVAVVAAAIGGALLVLPQPKPDRAPIVLEVEPKPVLRAEPVRAKSDVERLEELQRQLAEIAAEHKRLAADLKALAGREGEPNSQIQRARPRK